MKKDEVRTSHFQKIFAMLMLAFVAPFAMPSAVHAQEQFEFYTGVRQLGMGGAGIASVNDETALLTNPAGLGKLRGSILTMADPEITLSGSATSLGIMNLSNFNLGGLLPPQSLLSTLTVPSNNGKYLHGKFQIFPSFVTTNFGIGLLGKYEFSAEVDSSGANYTLNSTNDLGIILGYNFRLWDGRIKIGFTGKAINRSEIATTVPTTSTGLSNAGLAQEGFGVGSDVGIILTAPWSWLPALTGVIRDVGTTSFNLNRGFLNNTVGRPRALEQSVDVGFALSPILGNSTRMQIAAEYRGVLTAGAEPDKMKRIHAGLELNFYDMLFVRAGMNQRYWTFGGELAFAKFQLQFATYGEEVGTSAATREDRRFVGKLAVRF